MKETHIPIGRFSISLGLIEQDWKSLLPVMKDLIVVRAETRWDKACVDYAALSTNFELVLIGERPPKYEAIVSQSQKGETLVEWKKL